MSTEVEKEVGALRIEEERLREQLAERRSGGDDAARWRRKIIALTEHHRRQAHQLAETAERRGRERAELEKRCRRLQSEVAELRVEKRGLFERWSRLQTQTLSRFLGMALEEPVDPEWVRRLHRGGGKQASSRGLIESS